MVLQSGNGRYAFNASSGTPAANGIKPGSAGNVALTHRILGNLPSAYCPRARYPPNGRGRFKVLDARSGGTSPLKRSYAGITKGTIALGAAMMLAAQRAGCAEALPAAKCVVYAADRAE
jgi:hypothetical protein